MFTAHELSIIEEKCRYHLAKQGLKLRKQRGSNGLLSYNPANSRYSITSRDQSAADGYPLKIEDVMQAAGIA